MKTDRRFWVMVALLLLAKVGLHAVSDSERIPPLKPLSGFPDVVGRWHGRESPLDPSVIRAAAVDDYLNRDYQADDQSSVSLYVGYYKSQRTGETIHSPKNCLPGEGWETVSSELSELELSGGRRAPVNMYVVQNGTDRELVLYWYESHGRIIASEVWAKMYLITDAIWRHRTDAALVRIITPIGNDPRESRNRAENFAQQVLGPLHEFIPQ
jgi:EpsI family protein